MRRWAGAAVVAILAAGCLAAPAPPDAGGGTATPPAADGPAPAPPPMPTLPLGVPSVRVSGGSEPMVLADRAGRHVWIGDTSGGYRTADNGTTWQAFGSYPADFAAAFVDGWALAEDDAGHLYVGVLQDNRVDVLRSRDAGVTFDQVGYAAGVSGSADRPWLAATGDGTVALFYFDAPTVAIGFSEHCARSTDGGQTFVDRDPLAVLPGQGGSAFYDSQGRLYFSSDTGNLHRFDGSCLAGSTVIPMGSDLGVNNMVQSAADGTDLYMAAATSGSRAITLFGLREGDTGPRKLVVSPPDLRSNTYAAVAARGGTVAVAWYGSTSAGDPSAAGFTGAFDTYLTVVTGFWDEPRLSTSRLTASPNHQGSICMGGITCDSTTATDCASRCLLDYMGVALDAWGGVHAAYVDDTSGDPQVHHVHVPPARLPPPSGTQAPSADFTVRVQDRLAQVDASRSASPVGSVLKYRWDWGDGATGAGRTAEHEYREYGTYTITLTATDAAGRAGSHSTRIRVDGRSVGPPDAAWTVEPEEPVAGQPATFRDASRAVEGASLSRWRWTFGDGGAAEGATATHTFAAPGTYSVGLEVEDDRGGLDAAERQVVVVAAGNETATSTSARPSPGLAAAPVALLALAAAWTAGRRR